MTRLVLIAALVACGCGKKDESGRDEAPAPEAPADPETAKSPEPSTDAASAAAESVLLVAQAQFTTRDDKSVPGPARLELWSSGGEARGAIEDDDSNVFHKAVVWRGGVLTIGGTRALLRHWTRAGDDWRAETLWERSWGGKYDRLRDLEIGDVDGDGADEMVLATHDRGVIAVGDEVGRSWQFVEIGEQPDVFVHEVEIGDVDGDGTAEVYATPSQRNRAGGIGQAGAVVRVHWTGDGYRRGDVISWEDRHAKEILVADVGGDGAELFAVLEAETARKGGQLVIEAPVEILRLAQSAAGWESTRLATLDDRGSRFLEAGDVDGDGNVDLIAAGMKSGLWWLRQDEGGGFTRAQIDADSSGFEHAIRVADVDGDGTDEIYVAADDQGELRRYRWTGDDFERDTLAPIPDRRITWSVQTGEL